MSDFTPDVVAMGDRPHRLHCRALGFGLIFVPLSTVTFATLPPEWRTEATGLFSLMRNLGSSIGISIVVSLLSSNTQVNHAAIARHVTPFNPAAARAGGQHQYWNAWTAAGQTALNARGHRAGRRSSPMPTTTG